VDSGCSPCVVRGLPQNAAAAPSALRTALVVLGGGALVLAGLVGLLLPTPGVLLIAMGLSLLGTRFAFARRALEIGKRGITQLWPRQGR
jgi:hypothetical protein